MRILVYILFSFCLIHQSVAQTVADFTLNATACINQTLQPANTSQNASSFFWDFNQGDLLLTPTAQNTGAVGGNITTGVDVVFDGVNWYGFVASRDDNTLIRLDYGTNLNNAPTRVVLSGLIANARPTDVEIVYADNEWFGFVYGQNQLLTRLDFGTSLTNVSPAAEVVISGGGVGDGGLDITSSSGQYYVAYTKGENVGMARLNTIRSIPDAADMTLTTVAAGSFLGDVKLIQSEGKWYGYVASYFGNKQILKLQFGTDLLNTPVSVGMAIASLGSLSPYGLDVVIDNGIYTMFITTVEGNIVRVNLGDDLDALPVSASALGNFGNVLSNTLKMKLQKQGSSWFLFSVSWASGALFKLSFPNPVSPAVPATSVEENPSIRYTSAGTQFITLTARSGGNVSEQHASIVIENKQSPAVDFSNAGACAQSDVVFSSLVTGSIASYAWSFGDTNTSALANPTHQYSSIGEYSVALTVTENNGCENTVTRQLKMFNVPVANFTLPAPSLVCTGQTYTFENTSTFDAASNPSWQWQVDGVNQVTTEDSQFSFTQIRAFDIKLITSIPGCSSEIEKTFTIQAVGPLVDFSNPIPCENTAVPFTNLTAGAVTSVQWNFGDGNTSSSVNASHAYPVKGDYPVTLTTTNAAGCQNFVTRTIAVRSQPHPDFTLDLPPFSCTNTPSQFHDATPAMSDSNISSWAWAFGDAANGSSLVQDPSYTYTTAANYQVSLTTTTNFGCSNVLQKTVTIHQSPQANFSLAPACANQGTQFTDSSTGTIRSWMWSIQNTTYTTRNPIHVFVSPGNYTALLTVTGTNNCVSQLSKNISVPVVTTLDFSVQNPCATRPATFRETTQGGADPAVSWTWDFAGQPGGGSPAEHTFANTGNYSVRMNSTRQSGCVYSLTKTISMGVAPHAQFSVSSEIGPPPFSVAFTNTSTNANSYLWKFGDALNTTSTSVSPTFIYNQMGTYLAELTASNAQGCSDDFSRIIQALVPNVNGTLTDFKLTNNNNHWQAEVTIENKGNVPIINPDVYISISGHTTISEKVNGVVLPGQSLTEVLSVSLVPVNVQYACAELRLTGDLFDGDDRQCISISGTTFALSPYPNPANDKISLEWINYGDESMRVVIYNAAGRVVLDKEYTNLFDGLNRIDVAVNELLSGIYFISYRSASINKSDRFSISR